MSHICPYLEPPTIPEGMSVREYRIIRPRRRRMHIRIIARMTLR